MSLGLIQLAVTGTVSGLENNQAANVAFGALATLFSGGTAPTAGATGLASPAGLVWRDTSVTPNQIKLRDDADTVWLPLWTIDQTGKTGAPYLSGVNAQTGTTYTMLATDLGKLVTFTNAGAIAVTLPPATTAGFGKGAWFMVRCLPGSTGSATITPTTSTIDGAASIVLRPGLAAIITSDGANYFTVGFLNYSTFRVDGPMGINATPISQSRLIVGGSISANGADSNLALGGNRAFVDLSGAKARIGGANGGGSNVDLDLYARGAAVATFATGLAMAGATGGDQGAGTGNFTGIYVNGVLQGQGSLVPLERKTGTSVASYNFVTGIGSTYRSYLLRGWLLPATDQVLLFIRGSTNAGSSWLSGGTDYGWINSGNNFSTGPTYYVNGDDADSEMEIWLSATTFLIGNASTEGISFQIEIEAPSSASLYKRFNGKYSYGRADGGEMGGRFSGTIRTATAINGFQFYFNTGNIAAGDVTLWGLANA